MQLWGLYVMEQYNSYNWLAAIYKVISYEIVIYQKMLVFTKFCPTKIWHYPVSDDYFVAGCYIESLKLVYHYLKIAKCFSIVKYAAVYATIYRIS